MALEPFTFITSLDSSNPVQSDAISQGANHLRGIKTVLKATFPNLAGEVSATAGALNHVAAVTEDIQSAMDNMVRRGGDVTATGSYVFSGQVDILNLFANDATISNKLSVHDALSVGGTFVVDGVATFNSQPVFAASVAFTSLVVTSLRGGSASYTNVVTSNLSATDGHIIDLRAGKISLTGTIVAKAVHIESTLSASTIRSKHVLNAAATVMIDPSSVTGTVQFGVSSFVLNDAGMFRILFTDSHASYGLTAIAEQGSTSGYQKMHIQFFNHAATEGRLYSVGNDWATTALGTSRISFARYIYS